MLSHSAVFGCGAVSPVLGGRSMQLTSFIAIVTTGTSKRAATKKRAARAKRATGSP